MSHKITLLRSPCCTHTNTHRLAGAQLSPTATNKIFNCVFLLASFTITSVFVFSYYFLFRWLCNVRASVAPNLSWVRMIECNANLTFNHNRGMWPLIFDDKIELYSPDGSNPIFRLGRRLLALPIRFSTQFVFLYAAFRSLSRCTVHYAATEVCWCLPSSVGTLSSTTDPTDNSNSKSKKGHMIGMSKIYKFDQWKR